MRFKISMLIPLSLVLGVAAVQTGRSWLDSEMNRRMSNMPKIKPVEQAPMQTIVVATRALRYGSKLLPAAMKEIPWPKRQLPAGSFARINDVLKEHPKRLVLSAIEENEPILETKITGPGQRANLASLIEGQKKAVTVRVDDVVGVAGFVLPGNRVDVLLTRRINKKDAISDIILQDIRVLAIDQKADDRLDKPSVARAVTLEVETEQAQKLILAQSVGTLTLVLRPVGSNGPEPIKRISSRQLGTFEAPKPSVPQPPKVAVRPAPAPEKIFGPSSVTINVIRSTKLKSYRVLTE